MPKFAHISDCHLGAWRDKILRKINLDAFLRSMDICIEKNVDFILICGDLFDKNIPDLDIVEKAARKMKEVRDRGIEIYVIYGSHDYSPAATSIIDVLHGSGLFTRIPDVDDNADYDRLKLNFITDKKTNAKIVGISGRRASLEKHYYQVLDREMLEKESGFKIFAFHIGINEFMLDEIPDEGISLSQFPKGFDYYAGGHIHKQLEKNELGGIFVYPGTLLGWQYNDLENAAKGDKRGFYIVEFENKINKIEFVDVLSNSVKLFEVDADKKNIETVKKDIDDIINENDLKDSITLLKIKGTLSSGKPSDINLQDIRQKMNSKGVVSVFINRNALLAKEFEEIKVIPSNRESIEETIFGEQIGMCSGYSTPGLKDKEGIATAKTLLNALKELQKENESKNDYQERTTSNAASILKVKI